jgi:hypothetical protein
MAAHTWFPRLAVVLVLVGAIEGLHAQDATQPIVNVRLYNHAGVAADVLARAKDDVARIYHEVGVQVAWLESASERSTSQFTIDMIIRPNPAGVASGSRVMGTTLGDTHETGGRAFVFKDRVLQTAHRGEQDVAQVLAYGIAHEMGHVLLPSPAHSEHGIMRAEWSGDDLRHIASDSLGFTPTQAMLIRSTLERYAAAATLASRRQP